MKITISEDIQGLSIIALSGRMDAVGLDSVDEQFMACIGEGKNDVIIDMCEVEYMASLGIRFFLSTAKYLLKKGKKLVIAAPQHTVLGVLKLANIDTVVMVSNSVVDAKKFLNY